MGLLPVNLEIGGRTIVVVGGGAVAERKTLKLLEYGAKPTIIAPRLTEALSHLLEDGKIAHLPRHYLSGDLAEAFLVIAATDDPATNAAVAAEAAQRSIPADIADAPRNSTFTMPAAFSRGDLIVAVSTGGKSPALAGKIRAKLEATFGDEYGTALQLLGRLREKLLTENRKSAYNKQLLSKLAVSDDLPLLLKEHDFDAIDHLLLELFGPGFTTFDLLREEKDHQ